MFFSVESPGQASRQHFVACVPRSSRAVGAVAGVVAVAGVLCFGAIGFSVFPRAQRTAGSSENMRAVDGNKL